MDRVHLLQCTNPSIGRSVCIGETCRFAAFGSRGTYIARRPTFISDSSRNSGTCLPPWLNILVVKTSTLARMHQLAADIFKSVPMAAAHAVQGRLRSVRFVPDLQLHTGYNCNSRFWPAPPLLHSSPALWDHPPRSELVEVFLCPRMKPEKEHTQSIEYECLCYQSSEHH
jgi:hypothetical protein